MDIQTVAMLSVVTVAQQVFGPWQPITPAQLSVKVPEFVYQVERLGSVGRVEKSETVGCPIVEKGKTVGWSLSCRE